MLTGLNLLIWLSFGGIFGSVAGAYANDDLTFRGHLARGANIAVGILGAALGGQMFYSPQLGPHAVAVGPLVLPNFIFCALGSIILLLALHHSRLLRPRLPD
jgi:uncharacterized membrane protein YeaQ/YmgE (transglycosylase-associated protein family)